jgi:hypothetical protein
VEVVLEMVEEKQEEEEEEEEEEVQCGVDRNESF